MKKDINTLTRIFHEREAIWSDTLKEANKKQHPSDSYPATCLINDAYILAVGAYFVNHDPKLYVDRVNLILQTLFGLYDRLEKGELIAPVLDWSFHHEYIFYALAINDIDTAVALSTRCDTDKLTPTDEQHVFNVEFTQSLRFTVLGEGEAKHWVGRFIDRCGVKKSTEIYMGYALALKSILEENEGGFYSSLDKITRDYKKQSSGSEYFQSVEKSLLCFYGVGLVHLARSKGLDVEYDHSLIPKALTSLPLHTYVAKKKKESLFKKLF